MASSAQLRAAVSAEDELAGGTAGRHSGQSTELDDCATRSARAGQSRESHQAPDPEPLPGAGARAVCCSSNVRGCDEDAEAQAPDQLAGDRGGGARARIVGEPRPKPVPWAPPRWALALTAVSTPPEPLIVAVAVFLVIIFLVVVVRAAALALTLAAPQPLRHGAAGGQPLRTTLAAVHGIAARAAAHAGARPVARAGPRTTTEEAPPRRGGGGSARAR